MTHPGELLSALLDGQLTSGERRSVATHLEGCADCRAELEEIRWVRAAVQSLPMLDAPPGLIPGAARARSAFLRPVWGWAAAGAAALALSVGLVLGTGSVPEPMDLDTLAGRHTARVLVQPGVQTVRAVLETP